MSPRHLIARLAAATAVLVAGCTLATASPAAAADAWFAEISGSGVNVSGSYIPIVGDFVGDNLDDIIWYAPGPGTDYMWMNTGNGTFSKFPLAKQINGTYKPIVGNFGKDAGDDLFLYAPGTAADHLWLFQADQITDVAKTVNGTFQPFVLHEYVLSSTYDKIVWYSPGAGADAIWRFTNNGGAHASTSISISGSPKPLTGDFDGNGIADIFWYTPGAPLEQVWRGNSQNATYTKSTVSVTGSYTPVAYDLTPGQDGRTDIAWYKSGSSVLRVWSGQTDGTFSSLVWSIGGKGTAIPLTIEWGYLFTYDATGPDWIWYLNSSPEPPADYAAANTELAAGYTPLVGNFSGTGGGIFFYKAGPAPERLFTPSF